MTKSERHTCTGCGAVHELHRHRLMALDRSTLPCPNCGHILVTWQGREFVTYGRQLSPPAPNEPQDGASQNLA